MKINLRILAVSALVIGVLAYVGLPRLYKQYLVWEAEQLLEHPLPNIDPPRSSYTNPSSESSSSSTPRPNPISTPRAEVNLPVPFTSQAPHGNWELPYQEACEEASILMAVRYAFGNPILSPEDADAAIRELVTTNTEVLGYPIDQTAEQVRDLLFNVEEKLVVRLLQNPKVEDLKRELSSGNVIIVPAAGRKLRNPFFRAPGPIYHMLVLRGYTSDGYFITNDPGTRRGEGYLYPFERIMEAMHDWPVPEAIEGDIEPGGKVVIIVEPLL